MVQNCPNLFSDATRKPLSRVVTFVSCVSLSTVAYLGAGNPGGALDRGTLVMSVSTPLLLLQNLRRLIFL